MKKIKIGQLGIGHNHAEGHMLGMKHNPECFEIVGYAEPDEEWVEKRGGLEAYEGVPRLEVDELIEKCDAVCIECDVWNLTKWAQRCVDAGKHVHIDKPASGTLEEFIHLIETAKEKNLIVHMGYMYRHNPAIKRTLEMIRAGELGEIYQVDLEMSTYHSEQYREWLKHFKGGSMYIFGSHLIDLAHLILGEPNKVHSFIKQTDFKGVHTDDNCFAVLEYDKAIAKITNLSVEVNGWGMRRMAVMGSRGTVEIKPLELDVEMYFSSIDFACNPYADIRRKITVPDMPARARYNDMMREFYELVVGDKRDERLYVHDLAVQKTLMQAIGENI